MILKQLLASALVAISIVQPATITDYKEQASEDYLWEILHEECPNDYIAAGILGYFWRESFYRSDAVVGWHNILASTEVDPCEAFTKELDSANRDEFIELVQNAGGYGLGQWYGRSHLESLYDFCKGYGSSFADAEMQCMFTIHMVTTDPDIWETLKDADGAHTAGTIIAHLHDGSSKGAGTIAAKAEQIYKERCT